MICQRLVDERNTRRAFVIGGGKQSASHQRYAHRSEIIGRDHREQYHRTLNPEP
jgi:hypothetical protein